MSLWWWWKPRLTGTIPSGGGLPPVLPEVLPGVSPLAPVEGRLHSIPLEQLGQRLVTSLVAVTFVAPMSAVTTAEVSAPLQQIREVP